MGLIKELALLPAAPLRFTLWVSERVADEVESQEYSAGAVVQKIDEIEEARERGELGEDEAAEMEGRTLEQQAERAKPEEAQEDG